jgi:hypothetical protein
MAAEFPVVRLNSTSCHRIDTARRRDAVSAGADFRTIRGPATKKLLCGESFSGRFLTQGFEESPPLFAGPELVVAGKRVEQDFRVAIVRFKPRQAIWFGCAERVKLPPETFILAICHSESSSSSRGARGSSRFLFISSFSCYPCPPPSSRTMLPTNALASPNSIRVLSR